MKTIYLTLIFCFFYSASILAQNIEIEAQITDSTSTATAVKSGIEDATVKMMIDGLTNTPLYENSDRIANLTHMFMQWVMETDKVTVEILPYFADITKTNKILAVPYFCGWVQYSLDNEWKKSDFPIGENISATQAAIKYYEENEDKLLKDEYIIELKEKVRNNELESFLKNKIEESKEKETTLELVSSLTEKEDSEKNTLLIVNGKETSFKKAQKINPDDIENVLIVKNEKEIRKYTKKKVDGVIIITLKKE